MLPGSSARAATSGRELHLGFERADVASNDGASSLSTRIRTRNGGSVEVVPGSKSGSAGSFPSFRASDPPQAVITAVDEQGVDDLLPGSRTFRFGADFYLFSRSQGSSSDNGNNLIQRGLFDADMQYKLQVDGNRPSCRVKGDAGAVTVSSTRRVPTGVWHRATCTRTGNEVLLRVVRLSDGTRWTYRATGQTGTLDTARSVPLAVGGKVDSRGDIEAESADQFNGRIDNAFLNIA
jgi:hypothetical protein